VPGKSNLFNLPCPEPSSAERRYWPRSPAAGGGLFKKGVGHSKAGGVATTPTGIGIDTASEANDPAQALMNVISDNVITGTHTGIFETRLNTDVAGIVDTMVGDNFFASDGSIGSTAVDTAGAVDGTSPAVIFDNTLQGFWN
jgi:hypothetical protein